MTQDTPAHEAAAQALYDARVGGHLLAGLPAACRPATVDDALAIQRRVSELVAQPVGGWKCSVPTGPRPVAAAPIFAPAIRTASPCQLEGSGTLAKVEPEVAFVLGRDLPARTTPYADDEIRAAVREARLVLELIGARYVDPAAVTFPELLADGIANLGLFVGPVLPEPWQRALEEFPVTVTRNGAAFATRDGRHPDGHPLRPLVWLANYLAARGDPLRAGQIVTTGSYCGVIEVPVGEPLAFAFGDLPSLAVTLTRPA
ncbi:MAG: 2-keto-4-pentenoate hydratase [Betaproteobacteria bacterium]|nr:2-keto-4-pentenoate hydratase [Betaproteobacteria bacterium]